MRNASGRDLIAGTEWQPIIDVTDWRPNPNDAAYRTWASSIRSQVNESARITQGATPLNRRRTFWHEKTRTLVIDCADEGLPSDSEYNDDIGVLAGREERPVGLVEHVVIWIKVTSPGIASKLTAETFRRDDSRVYEVDCRREIGQVSAGQRVAFVTHDVREWGKPRKLKDTRKEDNRPVAEKIAEAEEFAHKLEAEQKLDAFKQRAFAAAMERGQI